MQNKGHIKKLKRFLAMGSDNKSALAEHMALSNPDSIYSWVTKGELPRTKKRFILKFIQENSK